MRPSGGRRKTDWRRIVLGLLLALFCGQFCSRQVSAMEERKQSNSYGLQTEKDADETNAGTVSGTSDPVSQELVSDMSFEQVQKLMDEMLGEESFSMETALKNMISGETVFSKEAVQSFLRSLFFDRLEQERANFMRILLLVLAAALFSNFAAVFENGQIGDVSFYMIYLLLFTILMNSYQSLGISMGKQLDWLTQFMKGLAPAYFVAVSAASGALTATAFYQGVLLLVWLVEWLLLTLILPGANLYVLLCLVNHLSKEDMLSKMAELLETLISWSLKTILTVFTTYMTVTGVVSGTTDAAALKATKVTISSVVPVVGGILSDASEAVLVSAGLMKNAAGIYGILAVLAVFLSPFLKIGVHYLILKLTAAVCGIFGEKGLTELIGDFSTAMGLLLAMTGSECLLLLISTVCFLKGVG
mgnify:CR=1 FL=1